MKVIVRMWTKDEYHKDVAVLDDKQVRMTYGNMYAQDKHLIHPIEGIRVVIDQKDFPEAEEFEVIVVGDK